MRLLTAVSGVQVPQQAPINIWHLLTNRCFSFYHPATAVPSVDAFSAKRYYGASAYGGYKSLASANKKLAPVIKQVFLLYSPNTAVPSVDAFSAKRYYGVYAYGGYKSLASANKN